MLGQARRSCQVSQSEVGEAALSVVGNEPVVFADSILLQQEPQEEQQLADACKRLVQNTIVGWNCLYLQQYLFQTPAADAIAASSPVSWQPINLPGELDFSDEALKDSLRFDIEALLAFNWEQIPNPSV